MKNEDRTMSKSFFGTLSAVLLWAAMLSGASQAQTTPTPFNAPDDIKFRPANIVSEGTRMAAEVYSLKSLER